MTMAESFLSELDSLPLEDGLGLIGQQTAEISPLEYSVPQFAADSLPPSPDDDNADNEEAAAAASSSSSSTARDKNSSSNNNNNNQHRSPVTTDDRPSFTADSPYFGGFCENEVQSFQVLSDALGDISKRTITFAKTGALMSEATRRLVLSCRLQRLLPEDADEDMQLAEEEAMLQRQQVLGEEMTELLGLLADVRKLH